MRVLGIDPGSNVTGYGVVARDEGLVEPVSHGALRLTRSRALADRLAQLHAGLSEVIRRHAPDVAVVERAFVAANPRAALVLGHARGVVLAAAASAGLPVVEYSATEIKRAVTGSGRAQKRQVQTMVARLLALEGLPQSDAADALAAALCHAYAGPLAGLGRARPRSPRRRPRALPRAGAAP